MKMKTVFLAICVLLTSSCAVHDGKSAPLTGFILEEEKNYFGYHTAWSKVLNQPLQYGEPESAKEDFDHCKTEIKKRYFKDMIPSITIKLAFMAECMSKKGWYWRVIPYGYLSSL